jgi:hypothetical protein
MLGGFRGLYAGLRRRANRNRIGTRRGAIGRLTGGRRQRRGRRRGYNNLMAKAMAVGGAKSISNTGPLRPLTVDIYKNISAAIGSEIDDNYHHFTYQFGDENDTYQQLDLVAALNADTEFLDWRQYSSAFVVKSATVSFNYCRQPRDGEIFTQMTLSPETDVIDFVPAPLQEKNTMKWDMTCVGTKNYNVKFVRRNMYTQDLGWQVSSNGWTGTYKLAIGSADNGMNKIKIQNNEESAYPINLGVLHITFRVIFRTLDQAHNWGKEVGGVDHPVPTKVKRQLLEKMFLQQYMENTKTLHYLNRVKYLDDKIQQQQPKLPTIQEEEVELSPEISTQLTNYDLTY